MSQLVAIWLGMLILAFGFLVVSILMAFAGHPKAYDWLRRSVFATGALCSIVSGVLYTHVTFFWKGSLSGSEYLELRLGLAVISIPMIVGLFGGIGTKTWLIRKSGNLLVFWIHPAVFVVALASDPGMALRGFLPWIGAGVIGTMIAWGNLVLAGGRGAALPGATASSH
jgi:hypothetical protein